MIYARLLDNASLMAAFGAPNAARAAQGLPPLRFDSPLFLIPVPEGEETRYLYAEGNGRHGGKTRAETDVMSLPLWEAERDLMLTGAGGAAEVEIVGGWPSGLASRPAIADLLPHLHETPILVAVAIDRGGDDADENFQSLCQALNRMGLFAYEDEAMWRTWRDTRPDGSPGAHALRARFEQDVLTPMEARVRAITAALHDQAEAVCVAGGRVYPLSLAAQGTKGAAEAHGLTVVAPLAAKSPFPPPAAGVYYRVRVKEKGRGEIPTLAQIPLGTGVDGEDGGALDSRTWTADLGQAARCAASFENDPFVTYTSVRLDKVDGASGDVLASQTWDGSDSGCVGNDAAWAMLPHTAAQWRVGEGPARLAYRLYVRRSDAIGPDPVRGALPEGEDGQLTSDRMHAVRTAQGYWEEGISAEAIGGLYDYVRLEISDRESGSVIQAIETTEDDFDFNQILEIDPGKAWRV